MAGAVHEAHVTELFAIADRLTLVVENLRTERAISSNKAQIRRVLKYLDQASIEIDHALDNAVAGRSE